MWFQFSGEQRPESKENGAIFESKVQKSVGNVCVAEKEVNHWMTFANNARETAENVKLVNTTSDSFYYGSMSERMNLQQPTSTRSSRHLARSFNNLNGSTITEPLLGHSDSIHYDSLYNSEEFRGQRNAVEVIRKRLKSHFMNPYQKYKHRGRKPWKLLAQLLKIFLVTAQVSS